MGAKILIIDHNDSFTYNLVGLFESFNGASGLVESVTVWPVDGLVGIDLETVREFNALVLSPGPGLPGDYPLVFKLLRVSQEGARKIPVLGICLGFQSLVCFFGGALYNLPVIQHGRQVELNTERLNSFAKSASLLFKGMILPIKVGLYHSWAMDEQILIKDLDILATAILPAGSTDHEGGSTCERSIVMAISHQSLPVYGLQFHPESYMTPEGTIIIGNWLEMIQPT